MIIKHWFGYLVFLFPIIAPFWAIMWSHLEHFSVLKGRYAGKKTFSPESALLVLRNIFSTSSTFQSPQFLHFTLSFVFIVTPQNLVIYFEDFLLKPILKFGSIGLPEMFVK
jgi:hypothetical protein